VNRYHRAMQHHDIHSAPRRHIRELWIEHAVQSPAFPRFLIAAAFLITFGIVRFITHGIRHGWLPFGDIGGASNSETFHIHHYIWGIGIALAVGYVEVGWAPRRGRRIMAILYGVALALILDEFALLLNLRDVYWTGRGRESIDAIAIAIAILTIGVIARPFVTAVAKELRR
jgi:hypothetical protein